MVEWVAKETPTLPKLCVKNVGVPNVFVVNAKT